jgi:hypothetical protein
MHEKTQHIFLILKKDFSYKSIQHLVNDMKAILQISKIHWHQKTNFINNYIRRHLTQTLNK